jgi:hypothetical protein
LTEDLSQIWREYRADNVRPGSVVIDIGSSEGYFTEWAKAQGAIVESFDARHGTAVGPRNGRCTVKGEGFGAYIVPGKGNTKMVSLASILAKHERVDFLKCDIEGGEYLIFDCDLSKVVRLGIEFHAWTTPDSPVEGLGVKDEPMPVGAFDRLMTHLQRTHDVVLNGVAEAGGYLYADRKQGAE